jgi:hypothetical protein
MEKKITLQAWAEARYDPPPKTKTLQRWARDGWIYPFPEKLGRDWRVAPDAVFIGNDPEKAAAHYGPQAA